MHKYHALAIQLARCMALGVELYIFDLYLPPENITASSISSRQESRTTSLVFSLAKFEQVLYIRNTQMQREFSFILIALYFTDVDSFSVISKLFGKRDIRACFLLNIFFLEYVF